MIESIQYKIIATPKGKTKLIEELTSLSEEYSGNITLLNRDLVRKKFIELFTKLDNLEMPEPNNKLIACSVKFNYLVTYLPNSPAKPTQPDSGRQ